MNASDSIKFEDGIYSVENEREYMWAYTREAW